MKLVVDTNVLISRLLWHGAPHQLIERAGDGSLALVSSPILVAELTGVLSRDTLRDAVSRGGGTPERTEPHCPWQNGRVERFFGTLKAKLDRWSVDSLEQLGLALADFRAWYNHVRPHHHFGGLTPVESWTRLDPYAGVPREARYFSAWDGMLTGYWMRR